MNNWNESAKIRKEKTRKTGLNDFLGLGGRAGYDLEQILEQENSGICGFGGENSKQPPIVVW